MIGSIRGILDIDAQILMKHLQEIPEGEVITYEQISSIIGRDILNNRSPLNSARKRLLNDKRICFGTIRKIGIKRLKESEKVQIVDSYPKRVRRVCKKGLRIIGSINYEILDGESKRKHNLLASQLGMLSAASSTKAQRKIESKIVENAGGLLPETITLQALME